MEKSFGLGLINLVIKNESSNRYKMEKKRFQAANSMSSFLNGKLPAAIKFNLTPQFIPNFAPNYFPLTPTAS
jgi:hypothetical protein